MNLPAIQLIILDVDGVLTDGRLYFSAEGEPAKAFDIRDGAAIKLWQKAGGMVAIITGRNEAGVRARAAELAVREVKTGVADKLAAYEHLVIALRCKDSAICYIGDDLPDLPPMSRCGFAVAVADAAPAAKRMATYVTKRCGGRGAVAETIELLLRKRGDWPRLIHEYDAPPRN